MIRNALVFSDIHLGWTVCTQAHRRWLAALPDAAGDAELIVMNGDIVDVHRGVSSEEAELVEELDELCAWWRKEGREVVRVEGNHDHGEASVWRYEFAGALSERVLVLHGHRFDDEPYAPAVYERWGRHFLAAENRMYARVEVLRKAYPYGLGQLVGAWGWCEDKLWRPGFRERVAALLEEVDVLVFGHYHFGPGRETIAGKPAWRSGAWVANGHVGTVDRMLRYRNGRWERIGLVGGRVRAIDDGR